MAPGVATSLARPPTRRDALADSLPDWTPFPEVPAALEEARARGWRLAILSNTDRDFIEASKAQIGVPFDETIVASEIGSVQAGARALARVRARSRPRCRTCTSARATSTTSCRRASLGLPTRLGQPARRDRRSGRRRGRSPDLDGARRTCSTSSSPRDALEFRRATEEDAQAVADLCNAYERACLAEPEIVSADDIRMFWRRESEERLRLRRRHARRHGATCNDAPAAGDGDGYVHPDAFGRGVGTAHRRLDRGASACSWARRRRASASSTPTSARRACSGSRGFESIRSFFRMVIDLDGDPGPPVWPDGFAVAPLEPGEERELYEVFEDAFVDHWGHTPRTFEEWSRRTSSSRGSRSSSARTTWLRPARSASASCSAWAGSDVLGTRREYRRQGLGRGAAPPFLPRALCPRCAPDRARRRCGEPTGATRLYEASACASRRRPICTPSTSREVASRGVAAPREVPALQDLHCGRARAGLPVPLVRRASSAPGSSACRAPGATGGEAMAEAASTRAPVPGGGRRRRGHARRPAPRPRLRAARAAARPRRLLLLARRCGRGARRPPRPPRARLDRRARRPEHAGDARRPGTSGACRCG